MKEDIHYLLIGDGKWTLCNKEFTFAVGGGWTLDFSYNSSEVTCTKCLKILKEKYGIKLVQK